MSKRIALEELGDAIAQELTIYHKDTQDKINKAGRKAIKDLECRTKDTAPFDATVYHRHYVDLIATKTETSRIGDERHIWYVEPPGHRLTHLLVDGHETRDGGRTKGDPFLANALAVVLPEYQQSVEEAVK